MKYVVKKTGRTWSIFKGTVLVEGGFFSLYAATAECDSLNTQLPLGPLCHNVDV